VGHDPKSPSGIISRLAGVSISFGMIAFARIAPEFSAAIVSVSRRTPAFEMR
jgi:hypothetical protein